MLILIILILFVLLQPGCIDKFHKDTLKIIELVAKDSAEKGLSEEAVRLFDLAKVYCTYYTNCVCTCTPFHSLVLFVFHATIFYFITTESWKGIGNLKQALESGRLLPDFAKLILVATEK